MRLRSLATLIVFFLLAAMISHSMTSTMVLGVTPVIFSKRGVVAQPDVTSDAQRINMTRRMATPPHATRGMLTIDGTRSLYRQRNRWRISQHANVSVLVAPMEHKEGA